MKSKGINMSKSSFQIRPVQGLEARDSNYDAQIFLFFAPTGAKKWAEIIPSQFAQEDRELIEALGERLDLKPAAGKSLSFDRHPRQRWSIGLVGEGQETFQLLSLARTLGKPLKDFRCQRILIDLSFVEATSALALVDAITAAVRAAEFKAPRYEKPAKESEKGKSKKEKEKDKSPPWEPELTFAVSASLDSQAAEARARKAALRAAAGNRVRYLVMQAGNDLTPKRYHKLLKDAAATEGLGFEFFSQQKLATMEAGAFLAVAQGAAHEDAGIIKLSYEPGKKPKGRAKNPGGEKHLCLVGKGVTFDTGGTNLKPAQYMWGMHRDMAGSAVAYALISLAAQEQWPLRVTAYLALVENATGPHAYRQNDVITSLSGKTIEVVHTDAEGRMILADTLHLAGQEKPDLILDFATLTGACVAAISTLYAGAFSNRTDFYARIIEAGKASGERVWPFPMDSDFADCLKSDIADIKQCRLTGGVDHIEAALFLAEFVPKEVPWVHIDLSAAENSGGLAHIDTEVTGFGVRFGAQLIEQLLFSSGAEARAPEA